MSTTNLEKLIDFVEGKLCEAQIPEIERMILKDPEVIQTIHELSYLKRVIGEEYDLKTFLEEQKKEVFSKIS